MTHIEIDSIESRLKFLRKQKNFTQEEMADILDMSSSSYKNYERGKTAVPHTALEKISKKLNVSLDFLVNGKDLIKDRNEAILNIRQNTQFDTKIDNGNMVITARIPLFKYIGA